MCVCGACTCVLGVGEEGLSLRHLLLALLVLLAALDRSLPLRKVARVLDPSTAYYEVVQRV